MVWSRAGSKTMTVIVVVVEMVTVMMPRCRSVTRRRSVTTVYASTNGMWVSGEGACGVVWVSFMRRMAGSKAVSTNTACSAAVEPTTTTSRRGYSRRIHNDLVSSGIGSKMPRTMTTATVTTMRLLPRYMNVVHHRRLHFRHRPLSLATPSWPS